jgi:hypothetical protein
MDSVVAKRMEGELVGHEVGGWGIVGRLNAGKSAIVFRATRESESAAVKVFDPEMVERYGRSVQLARIQRELLLRGKHHPNLIKILDGGECSHSGYLYVAMELIEAPNLASVLSAVPRDRIWPLISQVASAARFLESLGLVHRDIKPENIVVTPDFQRAVLLDLGVLRPFGVTGLTDEEQRAFVGTLQYSPPEFLTREEEDSSDGWRAITFYQLGAVLHDMVMRARIFAEYCAPYALLARAVERVNPKVECADVSADLIVLTASCLLKDPKLRLALVRWEDFDPPEFRAAAEVDDPRARIRRRRAMAQQAAGGEKEVAREQRERYARRTLDKLQAGLQSAIHQECIGGELFPPLETHDAQRSELMVGKFRVHFSASREHALSEVLSVFVVLELIDENSEAARVSYAAAAATLPVEWESSSERYFEELFKGVYNQAAVAERVKEMLYKVLDRAQQVQRLAQADVPIWFTGEGAGCGVRL